MKKNICQTLFEEERALFGARDLALTGCVFETGESPLKESRDIKLSETIFRGKYPLWYAGSVGAENVTLCEGARAGIWYTKDLTMRNALIQAPKTFRRCDGLTLENVTMTNAEETLWHCRNVNMKDVVARGHYFAMNVSDVTIDGFSLDGNYAFDGARNVTVRNARMLTKDAFWNCESVTVYDSFISGEYLGWNSKNLRFVNCTVESLQGLCYIENLTMENCRLIHTSLAFEYVKALNADVTTPIDSVLNPVSGTLCAPAIGDLILEPDRIDPAGTEIIADRIGTRADKLDWKKVKL